MEIRGRLRGFTLIELMIVVAVVAVILTLAAPSFRDMILMQRLRGINAQLVTDIAFARSEAVSRGALVRVHFRTNAAMTCYTISAGPLLSGEPRCDCRQPELSRCLDTSTKEIRTVQYPTTDSVSVAAQIASYNRFTVDPRTGGIVIIGPDGPEPDTPDFVVESYIDTSRKFRNTVGKTGRVLVCSPSGSSTGAEPC
jgi:type IV fimbrial biogenesis protein FimT